MRGMTMKQPVRSNPRQEMSMSTLALLERFRLEASPVNFELIHDIVSGNNPELRRRFSELGKNITPATVEELAREFLPHHFGDSIYEHSADTLRDELSTLQQLLHQGQSKLKEYSETLKTANERFDRINPADTAAIRKELARVTSATAEQSAYSAGVLRSVGEQMRSVDQLSDEMSDVAKAKFLHPMTGLNNRRAYNKQLAEIYRQERFTQSITLILGSVRNFEYLDAPQLLKPKTMILEKFGAFVLQRLEQDDEGYWLDQPQMAFLITSGEKQGILQFCNNLRENLTRQLEAVRPLLPKAPPLQISFGCADTFGAGTAAMLIRNAELALESAKSAGQPETVFHADMSDVGGDGRNYALYGRQGFTV
jgi:diguanylate cyclase